MSLPVERQTTRRVLDGARWATTLQFIGQAISWASTVFVVRFLTPADYGLFSMLEGPLELMLLVAGLGLDVALVQSRRIDATAVKAAFGMLLLTGALLFSAFFFGAEFIASYYRQPSLKPAAQVLAIVFLIIPFRVIPGALLDREMEFKSRAMLELVSRVASAFCTLGLAIAGAGYWALVFGLLSDRLLFTVLVAIRHPWIVMPTLRASFAKSWLAFGGLRIGAEGLQLLTSKGTAMLAAPILGAAQAGTYAMATQFAMLPMAKTMPIFNRLLIPTFARYVGSPEVAAGQLEKAIRVSAVLLVPFIFGLAALAPPFVALFFGPHWSDAATSLALMSFLMPIKMSIQFLRSAITSLGDAAAALWSVGLSSLLSLPLTLFAAHHGAVGMVSMWFVVEPTILIATMLLARRAMPFGFVMLLRALWPAVCAGGCLAIAANGTCQLLSGRAPLVQLLAGGVAGGCVYLVVMRVFFSALARQTFSIVTGR